MMFGHGGCSTHGLAVAALRRGFRVSLYANDTSVPFLDSVRDPEKKEVIRLSYASFMLELKGAKADLITKDFSVC